jgi:hypothetical protein
LRYKK